MNIGLVTTWFPSGAGYVSIAYKKALEDNNNIFIYARGGQNMKGNDVWDEENVYWAKQHYKITGIWLGEFKEWIVKNKIDVIIFNEQRYWKPIIVAKQMGVKVGAYVDYYTQLTVPLFSIYDFLFCNTQRHYSVFSWHPNALYIPWGTDLNKFKPKYTKNENLTFLVSLGVENETDRRGGRIAIKSFLKVKGNAKLIVCCQTPKDLCTKAFHDDISSDSRIEVRYGTFSKLPFDEADVFLYPSRLEGIGLALPEAVSSGLACITTNSPPMSEFVQDNYNGFLVNVEKYLGTHHGYYWAESICSVEHLAALIQVYIDNPNLVSTHKINSRDFAIKHLNWEVNSEPLQKFLETQIKTPDLESDVLKSFSNIHLEKESTISEHLKKILFFIRAYIKQKISK